MTTNSFALVVDGWFDGERQHSSGPTSIVVQDGRIADLSPGDHGTEIAALGIPVRRGGYLLPGLVDAHVHLFLDGAPTDGKLRTEHLKQPLDRLVEAARRSARQSLSYGVTLVRDAGDRHGINHIIRDEARSTPGELSQVLSGGSGIKRPKRYGAFMARDVASDDEVRSSVLELARDNDEIKLILTGIIDFDAGAVTDAPQFTADEARLVVETAISANRRTFAHCSGIKGLQVAAAAGVHSIEHGFFMTADILRVMAEKRIAWTPTFCPVHFQWARPEAVGWSPQTVGNLRRILDSHAEHLLLAREMGVPLLLGSDAGSMGVEHGKALLDEIDRYVEAGLSLEDTLKAATSTTRRHFALEYPVLCKGAPFEAVLLAESPFVSRATLRSPLASWGAARNA